MGRERHDAKSLTAGNKEAVYVARTTATPSDDKLHVEWWLKVLASLWAYSTCRCGMLVRMSSIMPGHKQVSVERRSRCRTGHSGLQRVEWVMSDLSSLVETFLRHCGSVCRTSCSQAEAQRLKRRRRLFTSSTCCRRVDTGTLLMMVSSISDGRS